MIYPNEDAYGKTGMQPIDSEVLPFNGAGACARVVAVWLAVWSLAPRSPLCLMWDCTFATAEGRLRPGLPPPRARPSPSPSPTSPTPDPGAVFMHPDALLSVPNVTWVDNAPLWVTSHSNPLDNIYYFVSRVTPIFKARKLNATGG